MSSGRDDGHAVIDHRKDAVRNSPATQVTSMEQTHSSAVWG